MPSFYRRSFLVEVALDRERPVVGLSPLNTIVGRAKFRLEMVLSVLAFIWNGGIMFLINLKAVYFQIPVHPESRPYL